MIEIKYEKLRARKLCKMHNFLEWMRIFVDIRSERYYFFLIYILYDRALVVHFAPLPFPARVYERLVGKGTVNTPTRLLAYKRFMTLLGKFVRTRPGEQRRCEEAGRPYGSILRATQFSPLILAETEAGVRTKLDRFPKALLAFLEQTVLATTPGDAIKRMQALVDVGFQYFLCAISVNDVETLNLLARQVIPAIVA